METTLIFFARLKRSWKFTRIILNRGGDVNFEMLWDNDLDPGYGGNRGSAIDFAKSMEGKDKTGNDYVDLKSILQCAQVKINDTKNVSIKILLFKSGVCSQKATDVPVALSRANYFCYHRCLNFIIFVHKMANYQDINYKIQKIGFLFEFL